MATIDIECFRDEYFKVLNKVAAQGIQRSPRRLKTRDLGVTTIVVHDLTQPVLPLHTGRKIGKAVAALEALQIIGGVSTPEPLLKVAPQFANYMEPGVDGQPAYFHGAYGLRVRGQLEAAINKLREDRDTRQAVITIWDPELDNQPGKRDYPCTVAIGLSIVDNQLNMNVLMRSNDAWLGLPNDVFVFTQLQWTIAHALEMQAGKYTHTAWSLHLYEHDLDKIDAVGPATVDAPQPLGLVCESFMGARALAVTLLNGHDIYTNSLKNEEGYEWIEWYVKAIAPAFVE